MANNIVHDCACEVGTIAIRSLSLTADIEQPSTWSGNFLAPHRLWTGTLSHWSSSRWTLQNPATLVDKSRLINASVVDCFLTFLTR